MSNVKRDGLIDRRELFSLVGASGFAVGMTSLLNALGPFWAVGENSAKSQSPRVIPFDKQELVRGHIPWMHPVWTRPENDFDAPRWIDQFERAGFTSFIFY